MTGLKLLCLVVSFSTVMAVPIVLKGSSPGGDTVIAISSSDPNVEKYLTFNFPQQRENTEVNYNPSDMFKTFSTALAGTHTSTGRGIPSFNPFSVPFFNFPINVEGLGLNFGPWMRGLESQEHLGNGDVKTVTAINDNGHIYGKVNGVSFDNAKSRQ